MFELGAGDKRFDARIGFDLRQRVALIAEGKDLVAARCKMRETISRVVRLGSTKAMRMRVKPLSRYFKALQEAP